MNRAEYCILKSALTTHEWLREVAYKSGLSHSEVAVAANHLFQNGNIKARVFANKKDSQGTPNIILTMSEIQAVLDGKLEASYELTSQGGTYWEAIAHANWNQYFIWDDYNNFIEGEVFECKLIGVNRQLIEELLSINCYLVGSAIHIPGTEIWDVIKPWQVTYWKTLPKGYRVRYQAREIVPSISSNTPLDWYEAHEEVKKWYLEMSQWYTEPDFEKKSLNLTDYSSANYSVVLNQIASDKAEYFILKRVVERYGHYYQDFGAVALDYNLSHAETLTAAHSLFQKGEILAEVYYDEAKVSDVVMTIPEIQANLDGKLQTYLNSIVLFSP